MPATDASGIVKAIDGVVLALVTVDVNVLPLAFTVIGFTLVTVPTPVIPEEACHVAFPLASLTKTFPEEGDPPVTLKVPSIAPPVALIVPLVTTLVTDVFPN